MDNKLKEHRVAACANFCVGIPTEALESGWRLSGILKVLAEISEYSYDGVAKNLAQSIMRYMGQPDDHKEN